jgi:hypothetical protein
MLRAGAVGGMTTHLALITRSGDRSPLSRRRFRRAAGMRTAASLAVGRAHPPPAPARPYGSSSWAVKASTAV